MVTVKLSHYLENMELNWLSRQLGAETGCLQFWLCLRDACCCVRLWREWLFIIWQFVVFIAHVPFVLHGFPQQRANMHKYRHLLCVYIHSRRVLILLATALLSLKSFANTLHIFEQLECASHDGSDILQRFRGLQRTWKAKPTAK